MAVDQRIIESMIEEIALVLRGALSEDQHHWTKAAVTRLENQISVSFSNRPDFFWALVHLTEREPTKGVARFVTALSRDIRYLNLVARSKEVSLQHDHAPSSSQRASMWMVAPSPNSIASRLVMSYLRRVTSLQFEPMVARRVAVEFLTSLESQENRHKYWTILQGVTGIISSVEFSHGIVLRKVDDSEVEEWVSSRGPQHLWPPADDLASNPFILEKSTVSPVGEGLPAAPVIDFDVVVSALRLLKSGEVYRRTIYCSPISDAQVEAYGWTQPSHRPVHFLQKQLVLHEEDAEPLKRLVSGLEKAATRERIQVAIDRLNMAAERDRPQDKILDLIIALEALYGDGDGGHTYKISMRAAAFLEGNIDRRLELRDAVTMAYRQRSALVHGGTKSPNPDAVTPIEEIVRETLKRFVSIIVRTGETPTKDFFDRLLLESKTSRDPGAS